MHKLKLVEIGDSVGVVLPDDLLARFQWAAGQVIFLVETPEGFVLRSHDSTRDEQMEAGSAFMRDFQATFKQLAQ